MRGNPNTRNLFMMMIVAVLVFMLYIAWNFRFFQYSWRAQHFMTANDNSVKEPFGTKRPRAQGDSTGGILDKVEASSEEEGGVGGPANVNTSFFPLLSDMFPLMHPIRISDKSEDKIWWHYPTFQVGSYNQITNNLKYMKNPDIATCTPDDMCGTFYHDRQQPQSNYIYHLPPVTIQSPNQIRVNYFTTSKY